MSIRVPYGLRSTHADPFDTAAHAKRVLDDAFWARFCELLHSANDKESIAALYRRACPGDGQPIEWPLDIGYRLTLHKPVGGGGALIRVDAYYAKSYSHVLIAEGVAVDYHYDENVRDESVPDMEWDARRAQWLAAESDTRRLGLHHPDLVDTWLHMSITRANSASGG